MQLCSLAVLIPIFASRAAGDPMRLVIIAFAAVAAVALVILRQREERVSAARTERRLRDSTHPVERVRDNPRHRPEFVTRVQTSMFEDTRVERAQNTLTS